MGHVKEIIDLAEKFIERRSPLQVRCFFEGTSPPVFLAVVTNISRGEPVAVKEVRVHFGMKDYSYAISSLPFRRRVQRTRGLRWISTSSRIASS